MVMGRQTAPATAYAYIGTEPLLLGRGYDSLKGEFRGNVLESNAEAPRVEGQSFTYRLRFIEHYFEFRQQLSLSLSASYGNFASGGLDYSSDVNISSTSLCLLAHLAIRQPAVTVASTKIDPKVLKQLRDMKNRDVFQEIGDQFVDAITYGGHLYIAMTFQARDESDTTALRAQLRASVGLFSAAADMQNKIKEVTKDRETAFAISGSGATAFTPVNVDEAFAALKQFPEKVREKPYPCMYHVSPSTNVLAGTDLPASEIPRVGESYEWLTKTARIYDAMTEAEKMWKWIETLPASVFVDPRLDRKAAVANAAGALTRSKEHLRDLALKVQADIDMALPTISDRESQMPPYPELIHMARISSVGLTIDVTTDGRNGPGALKVASAVWARAATAPIGFLNQWISSLNIQFSNPQTGLSLEYMMHVTVQGDTEWMPAGTVGGWPGVLAGIEGIAVRLTGALSPNYHVNYQVESFGLNPTAVCRDGAFCGTRGQKRPIIAFRIWLEDVG